MASEFKPFPPSEHKLKKLRDQGVVPKSKTLAIFASFAGAAFAFLFLQNSFTAFGEQIESFWRNGFESPGEQLRAVRALLLRISWLFLAPVFACALLVGLIQTRFLVAPGLIRFAPERLLPRAGQAAAHLKRAGGTFLLALLWIGVMYLLGRGLLDSVHSAQTEPLTPFRSFGAARQSSGPWSLDPASLSFLAWARHNITIVFLSSLGFAFAAGALSRFVAGVSFRAEHGMSREEVEAENRELELSPDLRRRLNELREE